MKRSKTSKKSRIICRWFLRTLCAAIIIWVLYSWIIVSRYDLLQIVPGKISPDYTEFRGAAHIHTTFSHDGHGTIEEVIKAAGEIGLDFIIVSDHNHMGSWDLSLKRTGMKPLLLVGNELSTDAGHLLAYNLNSRMNTFPKEHQLAVNAIHEDGGIAVIAHPTRRKTPWTDFSTKDIDGLEVLNFEDFIFSTPKMKVLFMLPQAFIDQRAAFASLIKYPEDGIRLWKEMNRKQKTIGFAGCDAHGPLLLGFPAYRYLLGTFGIHIVARKHPDLKLTGELVRKSLKNGNFYISVDGIAISRYIDFRLMRKAKSSLLIGEETASIQSGDVLRFNGSLPQGSAIRLVRDDICIKTFSGNQFTYPVDKSGAYRVEVIIPKEWNPYGTDKLWVITNHIYIKGKETPNQ